jgi:nuclear pore complex protein Nup93
VIACLAKALGGTLARPSADENARAVERTAGEVLRHYERTNRAAGRERDAVVRVLRIREAMDAKDSGRPEVALEVCYIMHQDGGD